MRKGVLAAAGALFALGASSTAFGGTTEFPSQVVFDSAGEVPSPPSPDLDTYIRGRVVSKKDPCLNNRKVVILGGYDTESTWRPYDVARSGAGGGFNGIGPGSHDGNELSAAKLILKPRSIGTKQHPKTCKGDKLVLS
jgi:hypothetical protein